MQEKKLHFKDFVKPLLVTLSIILICGGLLAILSNLLFVSPTEKTQRAIAEIYNAEKPFEVVQYDNVDMSEYSAEGKIEACYKVKVSETENHYLVKVSGKKGYANGSITLFVAIDENKAVQKVVMTDYKGQTLMSKLTGLYGQYNGLTPNDEIDKTVSGATKSANAVNNAVMVSLKFIDKYLDVQGV